MLPDDLSRPTIDRRQEKETEKLHVFFLGGGQFKYSVEEVLCFLEEEPCLAFDETGLGRAIGGRKLMWNLHQKVPDSLGEWMPGAELVLPTEQ